MNVIWVSVMYLVFVVFDITRLMGTLIGMPSMATLQSWFPASELGPPRLRPGLCEPTLGTRPTMLAPRRMDRL